MSPEKLVVSEAGRELAFSFGDMLRYHGGGSPGGVAHAFKVLERALPLLGRSGPVERRELLVETAFGGPGGRDGFELVTRAVSDGRYTVDLAFARPELGIVRERFVFRLRYRDQETSVALRDGIVTERFLALARQPVRTDDEELRLTAMKSEMAERVMSLSAPEVYDLQSEQ